MSDNTSSSSSAQPTLGALFTTGFVSAAVAFAASVLWFHVFPPVEDKPAPIVIVDMVKLAHDISKARVSGDASAFATSAHAVEMLKEQGYIVIDSRSIITAPDIYYARPDGFLEKPDTALDHPSASADVKSAARPPAAP